MQDVLELVLNPRAAAGRAARHVMTLTEALERRGIKTRVHRTQRAGHAPELVRGLLREGAQRLALVGGDGTFHEGICGLYDEQSKPLELGSARLALLPCGTGGDLRRTLALPDAPEAQAAMVARDRASAMDLGELTFERDDGTQETRPFVNIASFGIAGVIDRLVNTGPKWLGGRLAFFSATMRANLAWTNPGVEITVDGEPFYRGPIVNVAVANGRYFGGGMKVAPDASVSDGLLDVVALTDMTQVETTLLTAAIYRGTHLAHRKIKHARGRVVEARPLSSREVLLDLDGEAPGRLPARLTVRPSAVQVLLP